MILVTGGAGFIGSHLVEALTQQGQKVRVLDNLSTGKKENLAEATGFPVQHIPGHSAKSASFPLGGKAEFLFGDIADLEICRQACQGVTYILHQAALGSVPRSVEDPVNTHRANATGTLNILQAAKEAGVRRVIYASSSSIYGNISSHPEESIPKRESLSPHPQSPYAATKLLGEIYCRIFSEIYGLETVSLRYFNVFGPRQDPHSIYSAVIPKFLSALRDNKPPVIYGDGNQSRDFTYVENVVQANLLAMERTGVAGQVFNIACGRQTSINVLFSMLQDISGKEMDPSYESPRTGEVRHSLASVDLACSCLEYKIKVGLAEGLLATWNWFRERGV
jgi:nucleoside-diphosphate-sugar epimerase